MGTEDTRPGPGAGDAPASDRPASLVHSDRVTRPILVTGSHRSGTGWVGRILAASSRPTVAYLWEPFSPLHRPGILATRFDLWFTYLCDENAAPYIEPIRKMLTLDYGTLAELGAIRRPRDLARMVRDWSRFAAFRRTDARPLLKDPIAVYSAEWLERTFDMDVIVMIRHPAAFAGSLKRLRWRHPFDHFLRQPLLMRDMLHSFDDEIGEFASWEHGFVEQAILLWKLIHYAISNFEERHPTWSFLRLEDLAADPFHGFQLLYDRLGLTFDASIERVIRAHSDPSLPAVPDRPNAVRRDSRASVQAWRHILNPNEIRKIREGVEPLSSRYYSDRDW